MIIYVQSIPWPSYLGGRGQYCVSNECNMYFLKIKTIFAKKHAVWIFLLKCVIGIKLPTGEQFGSQEVIHVSI